MSRAQRASLTSLGLPPKVTGAMSMLHIFPNLEVLDLRQADLVTGTLQDLEALTSLRSTHSSYNHTRNHTRNHDQNHTRNHDHNHTPTPPLV